VEVAAVPEFLLGEASRTSGLANASTKLGEEVDIIRRLPKVTA
jgi:hypothetical protein